MPKKLDLDLKEGAFTKQAKRNNMSVNQFSAYVIKHYKNPKTKYKPNLTTYRRALFVKNAKKWDKK